MFNELSRAKAKILWRHPTNIIFCSETGYVRVCASKHKYIHRPGICGGPLFGGRQKGPFYPLPLISVCRICRGKYNTKAHTTDSHAKLMRTGLNGLAVLEIFSNFLRKNCMRKWFFEGLFGATADGSEIGFCLYSRLFFVRIIF